MYATVASASGAFLTCTADILHLLTPFSAVCSSVLIYAYISCAYYYAIPMIHEFHFCETGREARGWTHCLLNRVRFFTSEDVFTSQSKLIWNNNNNMYAYRIHVITHSVLYLHACACSMGFISVKQTKKQETENSASLMDCMWCLNEDLCRLRDCVCIHECSGSFVKCNRKYTQHK